MGVNKYKITLEAIHSELEAVCSEKMREGQRRYFKESVTFIGCSLPQCAKIASTWSKKLKAEKWAKGEMLELCEGLLRSGSWEEGAIGLKLPQHFSKELTIGDFDIFEKWLENYVNNWAHTDEIAPHLIGELLNSYPNLAERVYSWTKSNNRWVRRASAVSYVLLARHGKFHDWVYKTADALLGDEDEMVQKGVGWMLKCASQSDEGAVVDYLLKNRDKTSRLLLRYATEKVSPENRVLVLAKI